MSDPLLDVRALTTTFTGRGRTVRAVDGLSFALAAGSTLGIVGESGSGKSVAQLSILRLLPTPPARVEGGSASFLGRDLLAMRDSELRAIRGNQIGMIFQDPMTSLNPYLTIAKQLEESLELHTNLKKAERRARAGAALESVGIADPQRRLDAFPHQLSGGMRQRVMIAMALLCDPKLLIADEPTTALDVTVQAQILDLIRNLSQSRGASVVLITHDLGVVAGLADFVLVMYAGRAMEYGAVEDVFLRPAHPYTVGLLQSIPRLDAAAERLVPIPGQPRGPGDGGEGCPFAPRCFAATDVCRTEAPATQRMTNTHGSTDHTVACHNPQEGA